jgi:chromosomal replication initiation ATPase DnaA
MMVVSRMFNEIICSHPEVDRLARLDEAGRILTSLLNEVSEVMGVSHNDMFTVSRKRNVTYARAMFCFVARRNLDAYFTLQELGDVFMIDYSTVIHGIKLMETILQFRDTESRMMQDQYLKIMGQWDNSTIRQ